ncbi:tryptophan biosynthesis modulator TrpM [Streptomyces sp. NPDC048508]|uniref:tryptophan biosynthesis modulator TrpM n=1 Tax=Streptomyces sp. NPDC048508 TaxID=3365561 RepID=UPI00371F7EAF
MTTPTLAAVPRPGSRPDGVPARAGSALPDESGDPLRRRAGSPVPRTGDGDSGASAAPDGPLDLPGRSGTVRPVVPCGAALPAASSARDPYARLARGCRPRGCRAPARRVHGRRVRYVIGDEPGQVNGMRWPERVRALSPRPAGPTSQAG